jgi:tetratricopeptide (TPR) repeat protein
MLHVKQIQSLADNGQAEQAYEALDQLLALGPKNTEALKIKARLLAHEGRFFDEGKIWEKIALIDHEDDDAIQYLLQRQIEERENFYFTDDIPAGKRFLAYPKKLIKISMIGLGGCLVFLTGTRLSVSFPQLAEPVVTICLFVLCVLAPWFLIIWTFFKSLKWVLITHSALTISTRLKSFEWPWSKVRTLYLAHSYLDGVPPLSLIIVSTEEGEPTLEIDLTRETSSIRARAYLIHEMTRHFRQPVFIRREKIDFENKIILSF